jgi:hypothetical protein
MIPDSGPCDGVLDRPRPMDHGWNLGTARANVALSLVADSTHLAGAVPLAGSSDAALLFRRAGR